MKKKIKFAAALTVLSLALAGCGAKEETKETEKETEQETVNTEDAETIYVNDYVSVEFSGTNGTGTASVDDTALERQIRKLSTSGHTSEEYDEMYPVLVDAVSFSIDNTSGLTNGDVVNVSAEIDNSEAVNYGYVFEFDDIEERVTGLSEIPVYTDADLRRAIKLDITGYSPYAKASVSIDPDDEAYENLKYLTLTATPSSGLSNGDYVTVTVEEDPGLTSMFKLDAECSYLYPVDELYKYVLTREDIPDNINMQFGWTLTGYCSTAIKNAAENGDLLFYTENGEWKPVKSANGSSSTGRQVTNIFIFNPGTEDGFSYIVMQVSVSLEDRTQFDGYALFKTDCLYATDSDVVMNADYEIVDNRVFTDYTELYTRYIRDLIDDGEYEVIEKSYDD